MGLGLAISRAIAEAHGGALEARPAAHGEFHLVLPCTQSA
jgi:signal transduction histidine kinase